MRNKVAYRIHEMVYQGAFGYAWSSNLEVHVVGGGLVLNWSREDYTLVETEGISWEVFRHGKRFWEYNFKIKELTAEYEFKILELTENV